MEEELCDRFSSDIRYVDSFIELFSLVNVGGVRSSFDQILCKLMISLKDTNTAQEFKKNIVKVDSLRIALLTKFRLRRVDVISKDGGIGRDSYNGILRLYLSGSDDSCSAFSSDLLELSLWLLNDQDFSEYVVELLKSFNHYGDFRSVLRLCTVEDLNVSPMKTLKLLQTTLSVLCKKYPSKSISSDGIKEILNVETFSNVLVGLAFHDNRLVSVNTLTSIIPLIDGLPYRSYVFKKLWVRLVDKWKGNNWEGVEVTEIYFVLCSLAVYFFSADQNETDEPFILINEDKFWEIVLYGIGHSHSIIRKQSRFLLRGALDFVFNSNLVDNHLTTGLFCWQSERRDEMSKIWNGYFLVLEALEEKQIHLIEPVLITYENSLSSDLISFVSAAWNLPIYLRMFSHDSNFVVKCGLRLFFHQELDSYLLSQINLVSFLLYPFLNTLNNTHLYAKLGEGELEIEIGLKKVFTCLLFQPKEICISFYTKLLNRLCEIPWGPVPLFYVMKSLSSINLKSKVWEGLSLKSLKLFLTNTLQTHSVYIRGAIQCCTIKALVNFLNIDSLDLFSLSDVIGTFCQGESLIRGCKSWTILVEWFKQIINEEKAKTFVELILSQMDDQAKGNINTKSLARLCILFYDASFILVGTEENQLLSFYSSLSLIFKFLEHLECRLYVSETSVDCAIQFLSTMIEECIILSEKDIIHKVIVSASSNFLESIFFYFKRRLFSVTNVEDYNSINLYLKALLIFSNEKRLLPFLLKFSYRLIDDSYLALESQTSTILCKYFAVKVVCWYGGLLMNHAPYFQSKIFFENKNKFNLFVNNILTQGKVGDTCVFNLAAKDADFGEVQTLKGQIMSEYIHSNWTLLYIYLKIDICSKEAMFSLRGIDFLLEDALESLETGGREVLSPIMDVFKILLPEAMKHAYELAEKFCSVCWNAVFEHRKSEFFWVAMKKFINMLFQTKLMLMPHCEELIFKFSQQIYANGQAVGRIYSIFIDYLFDETLKYGPRIWKTYYSILVDALTYGPLLRKDQRIYRDTCEYIYSFGPEYTLNSMHSCDDFSDTSVRVKGIVLLLNIIKNERESNKEEAHTRTITELLTDCLCQNVLESSQEKSRYYGNSQAHRLKQRAMQSLLLLEISLSEERSELLMNSLCDSLLIESHQPSVKYLQEWLLVRIFIHHPSLRKKKMWNIFLQAGLKRTGCMGSFIAVAYHIAQSLPRDEQELFIMECMLNIFPWCMAQQFSVRLYAHIVLQKLWKLMEKQNFERAMKEYHLVYTCLNSDIDQGGNVQKNLQKLKENFYFNIFHPVDHFSIETIYYDLPRLANVSIEECIHTDRFESFELQSVIPVRNSCNILREHLIGEWGMKPEDCKTSQSAPEDQNTNMQKKIMPWKCSMPHLDVEFLMEDSNNLWQRNHERGFNKEEGLVVVASLIDRTPNLGGLCRTCEAFGVSEYVLGSLKYVEDRQFQNLSVSAERWIPISEVKPFMLTSYLKSMKEKGYSLIGAEQTAGSVTLKEFQFPKKSLLLLGNEKEGVPADLLPLLDVCVEVPQQGLIRSLNVHVTGAIFVWEYLRQYSVNK